MNKSGVLVAVLDLDSPILNGFGFHDQEGLEIISTIIGNRTDWEVDTNSGTKSWKIL